MSLNSALTEWAAIRFRRWRGPLATAALALAFVIYGGDAQATRECGNGEFDGGIDLELRF